MQLTSSSEGNGRKTRSLFPPIGETNTGSSQFCKTSGSSISDFIQKDTTTSGKADTPPPSRELTSQPDLPKPKLITPVASAMSQPILSYQSALSGTSEAPAAKRTRWPFGWFNGLAR